MTGASVAESARGRRLLERVHRVCAQNERRLEEELVHRPGAPVVQVEGVGVCVRSVCLYASRKRRNSDGQNVMKGSIDHSSPGGAGYCDQS